MSLSKLLRWGRKDSPGGPEAPPQGSKPMGRAEQVEPPSLERRKTIRWPKSAPAKMSWINENGSWKTLSVWLKDMGNGGMGMVSRKPVETGRAVWVVTSEGEDWQGLTRHCTPSEEGFQVGFERVKTTISKSDLKVVGTHLRWLEKSGKLALTPVSVRNAAEGRLEVVALKAVPAPLLGMLSGKEVRCLASALACHKRGNKFLVEMEVISDTYNNPVTAR